MTSAPIGVFDSGVGGLTVLRALMAQLPRESFIYLGDTARLPYGTKSPETIERYALQAANALAQQGVKCMVIACNTASAMGLPAIRQRLPQLPVIGVIEPGAAAACEISETGYIAVIATESTVRDGAYQRAILQRRKDAQVAGLATQLFVALAEEGVNEGPIAESVAHHYLSPLFEADIHPDTLVLGCTHFPMVQESIRVAVGPDIHIVDSASTTARLVQALLKDRQLENQSGTSSVRFLATDSPERFARVGARFLGLALKPQQVELIDLQSLAGNA